LALWLGDLLETVADRHALGLRAGRGGAVRLLPRLGGMRGIGLVSWYRLRGRGLPGKPGPRLAPDVGGELPSEGNASEERRSELQDCVLAGVREVWYGDPRARTVDVYAAPDRRTVVTEDETLAGGDVLPGLDLAVRQVFTRVPGPEGEKG